MEDFILTCGCGDTDKFATSAFKILFKDRATPPIKHTGGGIENVQMREMVSALEKAKEKFAYYFGEDEVWDLLKGVRVW